jgi:hypothetical protein
MKRHVLRIAYLTILSTSEVDTTKASVALISSVLKTLLGESRLDSGNSFGNCVHPTLTEIRPRWGLVKLSALRFSDRLEFSNNVARVR